MNIIVKILLIFLILGLVFGIIGFIWFKKKQKESDANFEAAKTQAQLDFEKKKLQYTNLPALNLSIKPLKWQ